MKTTTIIAPGLTDGAKRMEPKVKSKERVTLDQARQRLREFEVKQPGQLWNAATLAGVIWPDKRFGNPESAGRAARRILNQLLGRSVQWDWRPGKNGDVFGYSLIGLKDGAKHRE